MPAIDPDALGEVEEVQTLSDWLDILHSYDITPALVAALTARATDEALGLALANTMPLLAAHDGSSGGAAGSARGSARKRASLSGSPRESNTTSPRRRVSVTIATGGDAAADSPRAGGPGARPVVGDCCLDAALVSGAFCVLLLALFVICTYVYGSQSVNPC